MPATTGQHEGVIILGVEIFLDLLLGGQVDTPFKLLARLVELLQVLCQVLGPLRVVGGHELHAQLGLSQSPGGVQTRPDHEADILGIERGLLVQLGPPHQGL